MEIDYCSYHNSTAATWECRQCHLKFGDCCVGEKQYQGAIRRCPLCTRELFSLGAANILEPFWNCVHKFLAYPFKPSALGFIILLSLLSGLITNNFIGIGLGLFILIVSMRYIYAIIDATSMGKFKPPAVSILFSRDPNFLFLKQIAVFFLAGAILILVSMLGSKLLVLLAVVFMFIAMPASFLLLAIEKRIVAAINVLSIIQLIATMGTGYWVLYVFVNILTSGPSYVLAYFSDWIPASLMMPVVIACTLYFSFAAAHMMGYALLQYQRELGYCAEVDVEGEEFYDSNASLDMDKVKEANILLIEGRYTGAYDLLKRAVHAKSHDISLQLRLNRLMAEMGKEAALAEHSEALIDKLCTAGMVTQAAGVFLATMKVIPHFRVDSADNLFALAEHFHQRGQYKNALVLLGQIIKRFPDFHEIAYVYMKAARIYAESLNLPEKAKQVINYILRQKDYTDAIKSEAEKLARAIS